MSRPQAILPLAWPNMTVRSAEKIFAFLRWIGIMRNRNILVGHSAVVVADGEHAEYFDFGRYVTPLGFGRARDKSTDPGLELRTKLKWSESGELQNLRELLEEIESKHDITHGSGGLYASIVSEGVSAEAARAHALNIRDRGVMKYSGMNLKENNCSRFVAQAAMAGLGSSHPVFKRFKWPWTTAPSPYSNVIASQKGGVHCRLVNGELTWHRAAMLFALTDVIASVYASFSLSRHKALPKDHEVEQDEPQSRPNTVRPDATYLGGIGEGVYYQGHTDDGEVLHVEKRHRITGEIIHQGTYAIPRDVNLEDAQSALEFTYPSHFAWVSLKGPEGQLIRCDRI